MQSQIILFLFILNLPRILLQNDFSKTNVGRKYQTVIDDVNETPSPEWIRYQQERYQHPVIETNPQVLSDLKTNRNFKQKAEGATSARHENNHQPLEVEDGDGFKEKSTSEKNNENIGNAVEYPSIQGFIEFLKSLKQTWMNNSLSRIDDKIKSLQQLKDTLLKTIEKQFRVLWQDDDDDEDEEHVIEARKIQPNERNTHLRSKRGILDESSINFPPEAALMSINFLTFSVFLIKLVLQVVNIIKSKHYQVSNINMDMDAIRNG